MTLTKKHFEAIAEIIHKHRDEYLGGAAILEVLTEELSDYFERENPSFDRQWFRAAVLEGEIGLKAAKKERRRRLNENSY